MGKALIYGAGNIGRGFIGQLFFQSGYETCFVDVNPVLVDEINRRGRYPIRLVSSAGWEEMEVTRVRAVNGTDCNGTAREVAGCSILATAVGVHALPHIVPSLSEGIRLRSKACMPPLNILLCENMLNAGKHLESLVMERLGKSCQNDVLRNIGFVETSIGRMVPVMTEEMQEGNPLRIWTEPYSRLPVDRDAFRGEIPRIHHMEPFSPFGFYIKSKLYIHNMGHACCAYMGHHRQYHFIYEAVSDAEIRHAAKNAMTDCARALSCEYRVSCETLFRHVEDLLERFGNTALGDTVERVARDPLRKLHASDRLTGAALYCMEQGVDPVHVIRGIAYGLLYMSSEKSAETLVSDVCSLEPDHPLHGKIVRAYEKLRSV